MCIMLMLSGQNVWVAMAGALAAGMAAGFVTGILHTFMGIPAILAGILTQLGLYSVNLKTMGKANQAINVDKFDLLVSLRFVKGVPCVCDHRDPDPCALLVLRDRAGLLSAGYGM